MKELQIIPGRRWLEILLLLASDLISFGLAVGLVALARRLLMHVPPDPVFDPPAMRTLAFLLLISLAMLAFRGLYPGWERTSVVELKQIVEAITLAYIITSVVIFIQRSWIEFSRSVFILSWFFLVVLLPVARFLVRKLIAQFPWWGEPVIVIGSEKNVRETIKRLASCPRLGSRPVAGLLVDDPPSRQGGPVPLLRWSHEKQDEIQSKGVRTCVLAISSGDLRKNYPRIFKQIEIGFHKTVFILQDDIFSFMMAQPLDIVGLPAVISRQSLFNQSNLFIKRLIDIFFVIVFLLPTAVIGSLLALWIRLDSPGPVLYTQERVGQDGKIFRTFKFRTMVQNSEEALEILLKNPDIRAEWDKYHKLANDTRVTRAGKWLRRLSLDELPQVINILRGEMSLVGPRPYLPSEITKLGDASRIISHVPPGLTGWWQVNGRNALSFQERVRLELYYVSNWSLWLDLFIIIKTFWVVLFLREGI